MLLLQRRGGPRGRRVPDRVAGRASAPASPAAEGGWARPGSCPRRAPPLARSACAPAGPSGVGGLARRGAARRRRGGSQPRRRVRSTAAAAGGHGVGASARSRFRISGTRAEFALAKAAGYPAAARIALAAADRAVEPRAAGLAGRASSAVGHALLLRARSLAALGQEKRAPHGGASGRAARSGRPRRRRDARGEGTGRGYLASSPRPDLAGSGATRPAP